MRRSFRRQRHTVYQWFEEAIASIPKQNSPAWITYLQEHWGDTWLKQYQNESHWQAVHTFVQQPYQANQWRQWQRDFLHATGIQKALLSTEVIASLKKAIQPLEDASINNLSEQLNYVNALNDLLVDYIRSSRNLSDNPYPYILEALLRWTNDEKEWLESRH
jgi:hypothetical protein